MKCTVKDAQGSNAFLHVIDHRGQNPESLELVVQHPHFIKEDTEEVF